MISRDVLAGLYQADPILVKAAEAAIVDFERSISPGAWLHLDKEVIIADLRARVNDPFQVNQGGQPFCGPAAVLFELARKQPLQYVELCRSLFLIGGFQGHSHYIAASDKLRQNSYGDLKMGQADWMVLATLREMENVLFPVEPNAPDLIRNLAGMTKSWEMKGWIQEILGYTNVDYNHAYVMFDLDAMNDATQAIQAGGVAFALITAEGMLGNNPPAVPFPSHWIALLGNISVQSDPVSFDIYTWSQQMRLAMDFNSLKKYLWATVTGIP
ncbi:hypothetical protein K9N68_07360 [Kovacikia minuta CCNUW1]|uniref:hypothetical protein n=1 Tax=Kovacikia minuta TaxID=2931930 RepID=UPI001CC93E96|nr:hypothetical protein [Kovacikia minuta]UBF27723.1 hypothetical protein K9N68_07360 [Kovacikia minuta CCNUW1]